MKITPLTGSFAAEVEGFDLASLTEAHQPDPAARSEAASQVQTAFAAHAVLAFRDQRLDIDSFEAVALALGKFGDTPYITPVEGHPNVLRLLREADETGPLFGSGWHSDWSFQPEPPSATILYAVEVPPAGKDTIFTNQALAYEALSPAMAEIIAPLKAIHSARRSYGPSGTFGQNDPQAAMEIHGDESALETQSHPLVRTHPITAKKLLFVNDVYTIGIEGLSPAEAKPLLEFLTQHSKQIQFTARVRWRTGTLTMWDNRVVQHFAVDDYAGHRREMLRVTLAGETPT